MRELAGLDAFAVAADRSADEFAPQLLQPRADRFGLFDPDRGAVDQDFRPRPGGAGDEAVGAEIDLFEILAGRHHREHDVLAGKFARLIDDPPALLGQRLGLGAGPVPDRHGIAGLQQTLGHRIAHASHADPAE